MTLYRKGSRGEVVRQIQIALHLYPDGIFGVNTEEAVKEFQKRNNLNPDGIVGPLTLAKLIPQRFKKSKSPKMRQQIKMKKRIKKKIRII